MLGFWSEISLLEQVFYLIAIPSTIILAIQTVLLFVGGIGHFDYDTPDAGDAEIPDDGDGFDAEGLRIFSVRGIMAFLTIGGWVGVIALEAGLNEIWAVILALVFGTLALLGIAKLIGALMKLQDSGNIDPKEALGKSAEVYLTIPAKAKGSGKINLILGGSLGEFSAITYSETNIPTNSRVRVVDIDAGKFVVESE